MSDIGQPASLTAKITTRTRFACALQSIDVKGAVHI